MATIKTKPVLSAKKKPKRTVNDTSLDCEGEVLYRDGLDPLEKHRYEDKLAVIHGQDPYEIVLWSTEEKRLPSVTYIDIINYLIFTPSPYTREELRCYKGLDAYNQFVSGFVSDVGCCVINDKCVVTSKVLHSQRLNEKPLRPWIIAEKDGPIVAGHCTCMAGLGETCTHVASLLFCVEAVVKLRESRTVTEVAAYWKLPQSFNRVSYAQLNEIDFTSAATLKKKFECSVDSSQETATPPQLNTRKVINPPSGDRVQTFFKNLQQLKTKPAILSLLPEFSDSHVPDILQCELPKILTEHYDESAQDLEFNELLKKCDAIEVDVSPAQAAHVEAITRDQSSNRLWFRFRSGRITASRMKGVCHTDPCKPALGLVTNICYPEGNKISTKSTNWGCAHEKKAIETFTAQISKKHQNVHIRDSGFVISTDYPFIGASPDALMSCDCCGTSIVEVKCPFCVKDCLVKDVVDKNFCLQTDTSGNRCLVKKHPYYYQVQTQLGVCKLERAFFVVWTLKDLHVEEILLDNEFWTEICSKSLHIFKTAILPELVGKFYTKSITCTPVEIGTGRSDSDKEIHQLYCYCRDAEYGEMVACDNSNCKFEWFHFNCVGVKSAPKGQWFCPDCRKRRNVKRKRQGAKHT